jgi:hypothetical protein
MSDNVYKPADVPDLQPKPKMNTNEACWCKSGKLWKDCHAIRAQHRPVNIHAIMKDAAKKQANGYCSHPSAPTGCTRKLVKAHTVQKSGGLSLIAEKGHVVSPKAGIRNIVRNNGMIVPESIGVNDASTFMGYCSAHDAALFRPVEVGAVNLDKEAVFLLSLRAIALERLMKVNAIAVNTLQREQIDKGQPFLVQAEQQGLLYAQRMGIDLGFADVAREKDLYDKCYISNDISHFGFYACQFKEVLPLVSSGGFAPLSDAVGHHLQYLGTKAPIDILAFNLAIISGASVITMGWMKEGGPAHKFALSFAALPEGQKANAAAIVAMRCIENTYFRPSWWHGLPEIERFALQINFGTMLEDARFAFHTNDGRRQDGSLFILGTPVREIASWP